jgi:2,4-dienoyl-CoA reductase-like NADH-dependent reductase (Old Yellow Enzyme family)
MPGLFSNFSIKGTTLKNRIVFPPVVCFHYAGDDGIVTDRNVEHYRLLAAGSAGIIITEATAVLQEGRLAPFQLGIWSDEHITGMSRIASAVKAEGSLALLQIHHAGLLTNGQVSAVAKAPSVDSDNPRSEELTMEEIASVKTSFINAAIRAKSAGYQGIELHGAHGYLLNQFASSMFNRRTDDYGGTHVNNLRLATGIIEGIRKKCGEDFIIGYRMGANSPTLDDGIAIARHLESAGVDILHVSHGGHLQNLPRTPKGFDYNWIVFSGTEVKKQVSIPVIAVNEIKTPERAAWLIENELVDFVALGRPQLADPFWARHVQHNEPVNECLSCRPKCRWYEDSSHCPARRKSGLQSSAAEPSAT